MPKIVLLLSILLQFVPFTQAQESVDPVWLSATNKNQSVFVELRNETATIYRLGRWIDKGGSGYTLTSTDTLIKQPGTTENIFLGKQSTIKKIGGQWTVLLTHPKPKTIQAVPTNDMTATFEKMNNGYWWSGFFRLVDTLNKKYPLQHYSFRNGFREWSLWMGKQLSFHEFQSLADTRIQQIKDSVSKVNDVFVARSHEINRIIATGEYAAIQQSIQQLSSSSTPGMYLGEAIRNLARQQPAMYFHLATDMPQQKEMFFSAVTDKHTISLLKQTESRSIAKKEFIQYRRKEKWFAIRAIGVSIIGAAVLGFGIYSLVK